MAGRPLLVHCDDQSVPVTVCGDVHNMLDVAAGFAFAPEFLPGTGPEAGAAFLHADCQTLPIHISQCQYFLGAGVHHNGGDQAMVVEFQLIDIEHIAIPPGS